MNANEEMCRCYGVTQGKLCRMCVDWQKEHCGKTKSRAKCPAWGIACGKFRENKDAEFKYGYGA